MISLQGIQLTRGRKVLLEGASLTIFERQKIGLIGRNGCGKTTLLGVLQGHILPDAGELQMSAGIRVAALAQEMVLTDETALAYVLSGDPVYTEQMQRLDETQALHHTIDVAALHDWMAQTQAYSKPADAARILSGLGFHQADHDKPVTAFSGGWRMRLNLARCLMTPADLYLLDEPTNHLDMEAIVWLERWVRGLQATVIIISHDRTFLDNTVTHIVHIEQAQCFLYTGSYSQFEQQRAEKRLLQQAAYDKQQARVAHLMSFVERFRAKATKARQAQSRLKAVSRMPALMAVQMDSPFSFAFFDTPMVSNPLIQCQQLDAGYDAASPILRHVNLSIQAGDRIAFLGANGQGKSTLIKTLTGILPPLSGHCVLAKKLRIGYYAQHQLEDLDSSISPVQTIQRVTPEASEQSIRDFLGGFDFRGDMALAPVAPFSGGEKARLVLAKLVWQKPNILLLDEPTNHLDLEMRGALEIALQSYQGALILISHDRHLLQCTVDTFYCFENREVRLYAGDLEDYQAQVRVIEDKSVKNEDTHYAARKRLQNQLKTLEKKIDTHQKGLADCEALLAQETLYQADQSAQLEAVLRKQATLKITLADLEEAWLAVMTDLEHL